MATVLEALMSMPPPRVRRARDVFAAFYRSRAWRAARYAFIKVQPKPLRCSACGATARDARICVDHIEPIKKNWARRLDKSNFQLLCNDCNLAKASRDQTDFRVTEELAA
jgi:5-methylcytosine-specific restriction endonuclease McrA